jgi:NADH-quinone oxidoreductase subunit H
MGVPSYVPIALFIFLLVGALFAPIMTWVERKQSALMQDRVGANRADLFGIRAIGLLHPVADAIKMITKEDTLPLGGDRLLHNLAPVVATIPALISFAVIPYGGTYEAWGAKWSLVVANLDYGILYVFAIGSIAAYGSVLAGWSSNNNWGIIGGIRVTAQMISYEVAMGVTVIGVFMIYGTLRLTDIGVAQQETFRLLGFVEHLGWIAPGSAWVDFIKIPMWGIVLQPLSFFLFLAALMAENKRAPFDTPEGESELVAGYFIEYSAMKFGLFLMSEWVEVVVIAGLMTALFLGGWSIPYLPDTVLVGFLAEGVGPNMANVLAMIVHVICFLTKVIALIFFQQLIRWSLPRFRYDQVMNLGWKILLPISLANIVVTGLVILIVEEIMK